MISVATDTELAVVCNGRLSSAPAKWWLSAMGEKANLLHPHCTKTNVILDAHSMEPLSIEVGEPMEMVQIETNFSPKVGTHLTFGAPVGARLRLYFGGEIVVRNHGAMVGAQLLGERAMLCVTAARTVMCKTYRCNTTSLSGALLACPATEKFIVSQYVERDYATVKRYSPQRSQNDDAATE